MSFKGESSNNNGDNSSNSEYDVLSQDPDSGFSSSEEETLEVNKTKKIFFGDIREIDLDVCICKIPIDKISAVSVMKDMCSVTPNFDNTTCIIDNIIRCFNIIFCNPNSKSSKAVNSYKIAFTDYFYRIRHEVLFKCTCMSLNIMAEHSDTPFSLFGIESNRTPDLIIEEGGVLKIIEVTAVSSFEKAAQNKGMDEMGFESKYKREMDQLRDIGKSCIYLPIFFDMSNPENVMDKEQFYKLKVNFKHQNEQFKSLLKLISKQMSILTLNLKEKLILPSAIIFSDETKIESKHESLNFLYKRGRQIMKENSYREIVVSTYIYNKIVNDKGRLFWLLDNNRYTDKNKLIFIINTTSHRTNLELNNLGLTINELRDIVISQNTLELLKFVKVKISNILMDSTNSETGVKFYEKIENKNDSQVRGKNEKELIPILGTHNSVQYKVESHPMANYKSMVNKYIETNYHSVHYDSNYEESLINAICEYDRNQDENYSSDNLPILLGKLSSSQIEINDVMENVKLEYISKNKFSDDIMPIKKPKMKQPFILPIANLNSTSYCLLENKNSVFISRVMKLIENKNPFTHTILKLSLDDSYKFYSKNKTPSNTLNSLLNQRQEISNKINVLQKELFKTGSNDGQMQISKTKDLNYITRFALLRDRYKKANIEINHRKKTEGVGSDISYVRLPTKNTKGHLRQMYDEEMSHFKDKKKQSTIEGVGIINNIESDYESDLNVFNNIQEMLCEDRGENPDDIIDKYVSPDAKLLMDLKTEAINKYSTIMSQVKNSYLGHSSAFVSRLAHSLMFYSQLPFNSDYIRIDNLGYKNVLLIVRGGKKIFKSKSSKLFRLVYPISEELLPWYREGHRDQGSFTIININGDYFGLTPWSFYHESILSDSISFYSRVSSFSALNLNPSIDLSRQFHKVSMNVLLGFHNRRHTEVILANMRYILLSTLGDFTGISQILPEFFDFNYDRFQAFIRNSLIMNYPKYFENLQKLKELKSAGFRDINVGDFIESRLKNIFTGSIINNVEDLALMIYSTFLMTKAPYQKIAERARNLRGILEIHEQYNKEVGLGLNPEEQVGKISVTMEDNFENYSNNLFKSDFNFDPKFCAIVGNFTNSILLNNGERDDIETQWINIMNKPWDEMATSTGLRGDYDLIEDFWGQKGYFVIYKKLLSEPGFSESLLKIFNCDVDSDMKRKLIRNMNEVYKDKFMPDREFLIFHAVDKVQWRGGREIYVMDLMTKIMQQPIEKFMAMLCKKMDNELISIPSDRRAQVIHHSIFEKDLPLKDTITWYLTLDCSKWAPKSIFVKFVIMLLNMSIIPTTFKTHFMNYIEKLYCKRVYFNSGEVEALKSNNKYRSVCEKYLIKDDKVGGYYLEMPYSWVMGIFNYTSSFLHAANQKYLSYILMKSSLLSYKEETSLVMFAHSDDSGGRLSTASPVLAKRALIIYEVFLKSCNHLLSRKKSVVSRIYFEILSVIYLFKKLLALLPKFLGGIRFLPTDKGPSQDLLQSYSKSIEVMIAGSDFSISYLVMKIYSFLVWRFYFNKNPSAIDYERPVQYLGMPDAHPLFTLLCGSDADILRLIRNGTDLVSLITFVNTMSKQMDGDGPIKPLCFEIKVKGIKRGFEEHIDNFKKIMESWSIRNVNYHNTGFNTLSFLRKLNDSGFVGSLVNESIVRRISRCYYIRTGDSAITRFGNIKLINLIDSINLCQSYVKKNNVISHVLNEILDKNSVDKIAEDFQNNREGSERMLLLMKETLRSPLKIYKYLDMLSLEGRKIIDSVRTLKPTQVQLIKSARVFSTNFEPSCLVSYMKEENMRWALPNVKGIITAENEVKNFLKKLGYNTEDVDEDMLLRICRTYGRNNTKNIYLYSRVPGDIRQIKTYSAFLTFLSVNSFSNKEILGLTLKMSEKEMSKEYLQPHLIEEVYQINNIISLLIMLVGKCGIMFLIDLNLKPLEDIEWKGGVPLDFIKHVRSLSDLDVRYNLLQAQILYLECLLSDTPLSIEKLGQSAYYTFIKSQKSRQGWYGRGEIYIKIENDFYSFIIENNSLTTLYTNKTGKLPMHHSEFIMDIFENVNLDIKSFPKVKAINYNDYNFGFDNSGDFSILPGREIEVGIQCIQLVNRNEYPDHLYEYEFLNYNNNCFNIISENERRSLIRKIYTLPIKKADLVISIKSILDPSSFEDKIIEFGIGDFEEFIYTEILTEFGKNVYIDFNELFDNYVGSRLYQIFKKTNDENMSKIPKSVNFSPLPASEGSLVRIIIDYSRCAKENLISTVSTMDSTMMQLRSEYPEQMSTLLGEKLLEYYKKMFNMTEMKEIEDSYNTLSKEQDLNKKRSALVKLMTYWGYGSLVNSIQKFTLNKDPTNFSFFNATNFKSCLPMYSEVCIFAFTELNQLIQKWRPMFDSLEFISNDLKKNTDWDEVVNNFMYSLVMSIYSYKSLWTRNSLFVSMYYNLLLALLKEDDFISELQHRFNENYILGSLPLQWNLRYELIATLNVLASVYCKNKACEFDINYNVKLQRHPDNVPNFKGSLRDFNINLRGRDAYYGGFLNDVVFSYILGLGSVEINGKEYRINTRISEKSPIEISMGHIKHPLPINGETLDNDSFEDYNYELNMPEPDEDEIEFLSGELGNEIYKKSSLRKMKVKNKAIIMATIHWIVEANLGSRDSIINNLRQVGENIVLVTDCYLTKFLTCFPNSGVRLVNLKKILKESVKPLFFYYSFNKTLLNKEFLDRYLGGVEFNLSGAENFLLKSNWTRDVSGEICDPLDQGFENILGVVTGTQSMVFNDGFLSLKSKEDFEDPKESVKEGPVIDKTEKTEEEILEMEQLNKIEKINRQIEEIESQNIFSKESIKNLKNKYLNKGIKDKIPLSVMLKSILSERDFTVMNNDILTNKSGINFEDQKSMFLAPKYFSMGRGVNKTSINPIKDKKLRSEIDSFFPELSSMIGSNTIGMSFKFSKVIIANLKMWVLMIKNSKVQVDNKKFLLTVLMSLCNNVLLSSDESQDTIWQEIINKTSLYVTDDTDDEDDTDIFNFVFNSLPASRVRYRAEGT